MEGTQDTPRQRETPPPLIRPIIEREPRPTEGPEPPGIRRANRLLWTVFWLVVFTATVGLIWDGYWHITREFDGFFSPPHVFIYAMTTFTGLVVNYMVFTPEIRRWFGVRFRVFFLPFRVPGALFMLGAGFVMLGFSGLVLDNYWHTNFGLDETQWSLPHAMIGWSLIIMALGFIACRLALRLYRPLRWWGTLLWSMVVLWLGLGMFAGPLFDNPSEDMVRARYAIPVLAAQEEPQRTMRIYLEHDINRYHPALIPLLTLGMGITFAFIRRLDPRPAMLVGATTLWWLGAVGGGQRDANWLDQFYPVAGNEVNWWFPALFLAAVALVLMLRAKWPERRAYIVTGLIGALLIHWGQEAVVGPRPGALLLVLIAAPLAWLGAKIGQRAWSIVDQPDSWRTIAPLIAAGVIFPILTGALDLALRASTP